MNDRKRESAAEFVARLSAEKEARIKADRLTIEEAAKELVANTGRNLDRWLSAIITAAKQGGLALRNPVDFHDQLPYELPLSKAEATREASGRFKPETWIWYYDQHVTRVDLNRWLEKHPEWKIDHRFCTSAPISGKPRKKRLQTKEQQMVEQFRKAISELGMDPQALPPQVRGVDGVRAKVAKALGYEGSDRAFENAWNRALKAGHLARNTR